MGARPPRCFGRAGCCRFAPHFLFLLIASHGSLDLLTPAPSLSCRRFRFQSRHLHGSPSASYAHCSIIIHFPAFWHSIYSRSSSALHYLLLISTSLFLYLAYILRSLHTFRLLLLVSCQAGLLKCETPLPSAVSPHRKPRAENTLSARRFDVRRPGAVVMFTAGHTTQAPCR
ncbi:hypothetical protein HETIRDRAFT_164978 [Heterobasidion irregulare TC 32-1]|uniref:Uncharacterized protein n=1 Tax=Heterobasidion irregulare (strain TC 32-1) TaxID=747525 RepID=W4JP06_HETIT|nr:uncharacterized protein HETIRDRAFT_164978 [Heterobasidion irregulare TC 32-1]ETW74795.1 hypothetical protein HETIRDRAFT_164978 [Heterobasidion irregulare TC 32-1]